MVNHVVLFKLKDFPKPEKQAIIGELKLLLESLKPKISEVVYLEVGINYEQPANSFDICLVSHFNSIGDLDKYRVHPYHLKVVERISETTVARAAVDYFF